MSRSVSYELGRPWNFILASNSLCGLKASLILFYPPSPFEEDDVGLY